MMVCTEPLPNERVPTSVARLWSCSAPATISEADAEPPLIRTISGLPLARSPGWAARRWVSSALRPRVETISPRSRKVSDTVTASSSKPPGLLDRKSTRLNSSHGYISYAVFCLKKKKKLPATPNHAPPTHPTQQNHHP